MVRISAHSGFDKIPGNTLESIHAAIEWGVDILEIDISIQDTVPVLSHDKPAPGQTPLTLSSALAALRRSSITINCDAKEEASVFAAFALIKEYNMADRYFFTGYCPEHCLRSSEFRFFMNAEHPAILNGFTRIRQKEAEYMVALFKQSHNQNFLGFNIQYKCLTEEALAILRRAGVPVICWTVDEREALDQYLSGGLYAVTTNEVRYALEKRNLL